jgi:ABC-type proline/glycine betaine transport system ATPase subunit
MADEQLLSSKVTKLIEAAIAQALDHHRKLGQSIAIWRDGKVVILPPDQIPSSPTDADADS